MEHPDSLREPFLEPETYFGKSISFDAVRHVYGGGVITGGLVAELIPSRNVQEALEELKSLGVQTELA